MAAAASEVELDSTTAAGREHAEELLDKRQARDG
jgi:hypothetical protein